MGYENRPVTRTLALDEIEPPYLELDKQPQTLTQSGRRDGVFYVAGKAPAKYEHTAEVQSDIMFVTTAVEEEEAQESQTTHFGATIKQKAEYLRGPAGYLLKEVAQRSGIFLEEHYYTAIVKWLLPKTKRSNPPKSVLKWGMPLLMDEIARVKPKIIVCMGKKAFDMLCDRTMNFKDAHGGWFWSSKANAHLYLMQSPYMLIPKPELHEMFRVDLTEVARKLEILKYGAINDLPVNIQVIDNERDLRDWVAQMREQNNKLYSVDCEWHGRNHVDGDLRSIQFAWNETDAVYIKFRNENNEFCFEFDTDSQLFGNAPVSRGPHPTWLDSPPPGMEDYARDIGARSNHVQEDKHWDLDFNEAFALVKQERKDALKPYRRIGKILALVMNQKDVQFCGHHYVADAVWMDYQLGLDVISKCYMDTEFAQQTVDESSELKLERGIAMKYTTLGRYDLDLVLWKKDNKKRCENGYGFIPDDIIITYACKDVLAVMRAVPVIRKLLEAQRLWDYYVQTFNPFVTDVFFTFAQTGLPMDVPLMDELRELFNYCRGQLDTEFRLKVVQDAKERLVGKCIEVLGMDPGVRVGISTVNMVLNGELEQAWKELKQVLPLNKFNEVKPFLDHLECAPTFNIRAPDQMRRWLFEVSGMTPVKTTKSTGITMDWEKVLELPPERQALFTPSVDKQTLQIMASHLPLADALLDLNVVGNLCKAFLKEPSTYFDEDLGEEVVEEAGLHQWVASDYRIHGQTSTTETGRPRGWAPNSLNFPSYVNKRIGRAMARIIAARVADGTLPQTLERWSHVKDENDLPSIRSLIKAVAGMCFVESDFATAEIRGMAYISGDKALMRLMNDADPEWAFTNDGSKVRVAYTPFKESGIPTSKQNPAYLLKKMEGGKVIKEYTEADLLRNEQTGEVVHCRFDLHWSLAEWTYEKPREEMLDKIERAAAKVINFSSAYGASPSSLERKIESDTGVKPAEGTGQKGLDAIAARQPRATEFLEEMQDTPARKGWYRAASGRLRHCVMHGRDTGIGYRQRNSIESAAGRELRNFPMQESVASTAARAGRDLGKLYRQLGMKARVITILYDSVVTMCPFEEREVVAHLHQQYMCDANNWVYHDEYGTRELTYPIDTDFNYRWSTKPSKAEKAQLNDMSWNPTPEHLRWLLSFRPDKATPFPAGLPA